MIHQTGRRKTIFTALLIALAVTAAAASAYANSTLDSIAASFPDNTEARKYLQSIVNGPTSTAIQAASRILTLSAGVGHVRFEVQKTDDSYYLLFLNEESGKYPVAAAGNYIIKRSLSDGAFDQVKVFLSDDPGMFVRLFPDASGNDRVFLDLYVEGQPVYRGVPVPISFQQVLSSSFAWIMQMTANDVEWEDLFPPSDRSEYGAVASMVEKARSALPTLPDADDGAMDQNGNLVYIASLRLQDQLPGFNCSGFAKWIADGLYKPETGNYLSIDELKKKQIGLRGNAYTNRFEDARDPFFGLDWSRNIATALMRADYPGRTIGPKDADVNNVPFNKYVEDVGYPVARLGQILYLLAVRDPSYFYIGSVNREFGTNPTLRQHVHVVVLFPYFNKSGDFVVSVMERNVESSVSSLDQRYHNDYIHLVRIRASKDYTPPKIRIAGN